MFFYISSCDGLVPFI